MSRLNATLVYYTMSVVASFANALLFTISAIYYVEKVGLNPLQLVLVGTVLEAICFLCEIPTGVVADTLSRRLSVIIGMGLTGLAFGLQALAPSFTLVLFCQVLWGLGATFISGANNAWLTDEVGEAQVGPIFLRNSQFCQIAGVLGIVGSVGLGLVEIRLPIVASGLIYLGLTLFLSLAMPETGFKPARTHELPGPGRFAGTFGEGLRTVRQRPVLLLLLGVAFFVGAASEGYDRLWQAHLLTNFQFPAIGWSSVVWFGLISIIFEVVGMAALQITRRWLDTNNLRQLIRWLLVIQALSVAGRILIGLAGSFELALAALLISTALRSVSEPLYAAWLTRSIPSRVRATVLSMSSQVDACGQIAGGPGIGWLGQAVSLRLAIAVTGLVLLPNLYLYKRLGNQEESETELTAVSDSSLGASL